MTSDRQRRANRDNAKASTGPKTRTGKLHSAQNALRHGLNIPVWNDPTLAAQAAAIARKIAGPNADPEAVEWARRIGEAQIDVNRTRACRTALLTELLVGNYLPHSFNKAMIRSLSLILSGRQLVSPSHEKAIEMITNHQAATRNSRQYWRVNRPSWLGSTDTNGERYRGVSPPFVTSTWRLNLDIDRTNIK